VIIFGSRGRETELGSGTFYCPHCGTTRPYKRKRLANYFTLYFIPLFQVQNLGEFVQCQVCKQTYKSDVLNLRPPTAAERFAAAARADLDSGTPVHMAERKLINSGVDEATAKKAVEMVMGGRRRTCPQCGYVYRETVERCTNCGSLLTTEGI
jgi:predicted RNA-binding Zn-ribbon protein involved in translation (DUF1610 family)